MGGVYVGMAKHYSIRPGIIAEEGPTDETVVLQRECTVASDATSILSGAWQELSCLTC